MCMSSLTPYTGAPQLRLGKGVSHAKARMREGWVHSRLRGSFHFHLPNVSSWPRDAAMTVSGQCWELLLGYCARVTTAWVAGEV
jgi:hypothetical protein